MSKAGPGPGRNPGQRPSPHRQLHINKNRKEVGTAMEKRSPSGPAEELRAAATLLRDTAARAAKEMPPPWGLEAGFNGEWLIGSATPHLVANARKPAADWIALMSPDKAESLADWLDATADEYEREKCDDPRGVCNRCECDPSVLPALTFAAAIIDASSHGSEAGR